MSRAKRERPQALATVGMPSLLTVLTALCLACFSVMAHWSAQADLRLAKKTVQAAQEFYEADTAAMRLLAKRLSAGERDVEFSLPCGAYAALEARVQVVVQNGTATVRFLRWQRVTDPDFTILDESVNVWNGE